VTSPTVTIIVARARNGVIGRDNTLPWHLPEDLQHFKRTTMHHPVLMGRRTYESIGRPLPGRRIIVVSTDPLWSAPGCERGATLASAIAMAGKSMDRHPGIDPREVFIAGGAQLYREALPLADRVIVTAIDLDATGDVSFPDLDPAVWQRESRLPHVSRTGLEYAIETYTRTGAWAP
jgi:dihydrofolate reductase